MDASSRSLVVAEGLVRTFRADGVERPVLQGLALTVDSREWVAVMGPSGCGKSTMLHILGGLDLPDAGSVLVDGQDITRLTVTDRAVLRRRQIGYVFQQYN